MDDFIEFLALEALERQEALKNRDADWNAGNLRFLCHEAQCVIYDAFYRNKWRETGIIASRRFGKSTLGFILCLEYALRNPYTIARFIPPEVKQAWQIVLPIWGKIQRAAPKGLVEYMAADKAFRVGQGSWIFLGGFDSQNDAQRGGEASFIVCDEGGSTNPEQYLYILRSVLLPQLLDTKGRMLHLGTVPPDLAHPFLTETIHKCEVNECYFEFTINDNPRLDEEQRQQAIEDCGGEDTEEYEREYLCKRIRTPHLMVVPKFNETFAVRECGFPQFAWWHVAGDWGGVTDKTVIYAGWYDHRHWQNIIWDERVYDPHTPSDEIAAGIKELIAYKDRLFANQFPHDLKYKGGFREQEVMCWLDVPGQVQVDLRQQHGLQVRVPLKDDWAAGIRMLNTTVNLNRLKIHPRCKFLTQSLREGKFNLKRTDFERTGALGHCDGIAAAIYWIRMANKEDPTPPKRMDPQHTWVNPNKMEDIKLRSLADSLSPKKKPSFLRG